MSWVDKFYDKQVKGFELMVTHNKFYKLYAKDNASGDVIFLKNFISKEDYCRFLMEAVMMRLSCKKEDVKKSRKIWKNMLYFLRDSSRITKTFLFAMVFSFGLCGCQYVPENIQHTKSEVLTVDGKLYSCEYVKGSTLKCNKEIKNETY